MRTCAQRSRRDRTKPDQPVKGQIAAMSESSGGTGGRTALVVAHTGRKDSLASAREVVSRLIEAGLTVRVLTPEAGDLACAGVEEVGPGTRAGGGAENCIRV